MSRLTIRHETLYTYDRLVSFGVHRLLIRPRDSHAIRVVEAYLTFSPGGETRWAFDALGNSVCRLSLHGQARSLSIINQLVIERYPAPLEGHAPYTAVPVVYAPADRSVLAPFMEPVSQDPQGVLLDWLRAQISSPGEPAIDFLLRLNTAIHSGFAYQGRVEEGTQDPAQTVAARSGTCRDFAWLMVESLRRLGYAARFVTGYLYSPQNSGMRGSGATHAWCEAFLPDIGWTEFDPTNGLAESQDLIPVAVTRTPAEASPVSGEVFGAYGGSNLQVLVDVRPADPVSAAA
jgi:transglutaminase-like putative cysteine protease